MKPVFLNNFGYLESNIPYRLFEKLKVECAKSDTYRNSPTEDTVQEMQSGLTGNGVAKHYYVKDNVDELNNFIMQMFKEYDRSFNFVETLKHTSHSIPFISVDPWINIQYKHEFIPTHTHDGVITFVMWIKIPYDIEAELSVGDKASTFEFTYSSVAGTQLTQRIPVSKEYEGKIVMFPSGLSHTVYPFYSSDDSRISISGNVSYDTGKLSYWAGE
jgi:histidinol phosphatase-like enzyme